MNLFEKPRGVQTRWVSFENPTTERGRAALENKGCKGHPCDSLRAGETKTLLDTAGSGMISRIWMTIMDRSPEMLRSLRLDMFWDGSERAAVSCPVGDFFGIGLGRTAAFESALFSDPEGRSFNCFIPMPFREGARVTLTNEYGTDLTHLFYDIDLLMNVEHSAETLYFHAHWRREAPNELGKDFVILPAVQGSGRFLGCNVGVSANPIYEKAWWGEGEVKVWLGEDEHPTLCGTGTEDFIGTAWGQGKYAHRTQGCPVADEKSGQWAFYRYHVDDPVFFEEGCRVSIQTIGGCPKEKVIELREKGAPLSPVTIDPADMRPLVHLMELKQPVDLTDPALPNKWCNFWRQDDWSATAYFYLDSAGGVLPALAPVETRIAGLSGSEDARARAGM